MILGHPNVFAIEVFSERMADSPKGIWGRSCVHVAGEAIGDITEPHCSLDHFVATIAELVVNLESLSAPEFATLPDIEVFSFLDERLFRDVGQSEKEMKADWNRFGRFSFLTNVGEQFDGWKSFIFTRSDGSLRIVSKHEDADPHVFPIMHKEFISTASVFLAWAKKETTEPNQAPEPTTMAVTIRAPSRTNRASHGRGSS